MLTAEVPGLRLRSVGGEIGGGGSIKIRGTGSLVLSNEPVIFVDGVRVDNRDNVNSAAFVNSRGGPSRLNDLALADVERIEVIKGPAAATLYGTEASNGVIQIFTKRGQQGAPRFEVSLRQGAAFLYDAANKYPVVWGVDSDTGQLLSANLVDLERERGDARLPDGASHFGVRQRFGRNPESAVLLLGRCPAGPGNGRLPVAEQAGGALQSVLHDRELRGRCEHGVHSPEDSHFRR